MPSTMNARAEPSTRNAGARSLNGDAGAEPPRNAGAEPPTRNTGAGSPNGDADGSEPPNNGNPRTVPFCRNRAVPDNGNIDNTVYLLSDGWRQSLPYHDHEWVSNTFFKRSARGRAEFDMSKITQLWFHPAEPMTFQGKPPKPSPYFATRLFLWMPRKLWRVKLVCPREECYGQELTSAGVYPTVRPVLNVDGFYNLAGEYLECRRCKGKIISWSKPVLDQLDPCHRIQFQVVLTYRFACDMSIITMMRDRSRGNSPLQMLRKLRETHTVAWLRKTALYLCAVKKFTADRERDLVDCPQCTPPPKMPSLPTHSWLLGVYHNDVMERIDVIRASITSVFGRILKIDSKITKKIAGEGSGIATWKTNVGNEHGQILMSVLTDAGGVGLHRMTHGIVKRYEEANQPHPELLYVVKDCCGEESKLFREWPDVPVRLDIWHFMTRLGRGCTNKQHPLYRFFLRRLSDCIFTWSAEDIDKIVRAKRAELAKKHITGLSINDIIKRIGRKELTKHCRRATRGTEETTRLIRDLLAALDGDQGRDTHGIPLFDSDKIRQIWESEKKHVACIQDPPGVALYTKTGEIVKGSVLLPLVKCARGITSLESFHLHLNRFIPGTSANNVHFQAYLLDGIHRWNCDRARDALGTAVPSHVSYGSFYESHINRLTEELFGHKINPTLVAPWEYTSKILYNFGLGIQFKCSE
ncbi:uncharacterized protein LOC129281451 isoform X1 [Lytechinus pictus]|uniref:uncharacterized protein LOC129281451 isoform X1 n=2 Tax=Lytechinus pictus TaxID=7653 RepID=UPI0030B9F6F1